MAKRTVKFKDGSTGSYDKEPSSQLTFMPCAKCGKLLRSNEAAMGDTCITCLSSERDTIKQKAEKIRLSESRKVEDKIMSAFTTPDKIPPIIFDHDINGIVYTIEIHKGVVDKIYIRLKEGDYIYFPPDGLHKGRSTDVGNWVYDHLRTNKLLRK